MARARANEDGSVTEIVVEFYSQRASQGGLCLIEAAYVSASGNGCYGSLAVNSDLSIDGLRRIADAIHAKKGYAFLQLWHAGRVSHGSLQPDQKAPVGPSASSSRLRVWTADGNTDATPNRVLETEEVSGIVEEYRLAATRALAAGFDGVELQAGDGYLLDQFLEDSTNQRYDQYGGCLQNRARLLFEVTRALVSVWGPGRVGVRISPGSHLNGMADSNPELTFGYVAAELDRLGLGYLHVSEPRAIESRSCVAPPTQATFACGLLRRQFSGTIIAAGGFTRDSAASVLAHGDADLVAFGRLFAANPDLPTRLRRNWPLTVFNEIPSHGRSGRGYTDYPAHPESDGPSVSQSTLVR